MTETFRRELMSKDGSAITVSAESGREDSIEITLRREDREFVLQTNDPKDGFLIAEAIKCAAQSLLTSR